MNSFKDTDTGVVRKENQDRIEYLEKNDVGFAILCDGMGGHFGGALASSITINVFKEVFLLKTPTLNDNLYEWFNKGLIKAREAMIDEAGSEVQKQDMGTTVVAALIFKKANKIFVFNVGDSRAYVFNGLLHQVTHDHNLMNYYIRNNNMRPTDAARIPSASALTSALGPKKKTQLEVFEIDKDSNVKTLILTSDGIHDYIKKPFFEHIIASEEPLPTKTRSLIEEAIVGKSTDNLSVIIVEVE